MVMEDVVARMRDRDVNVRVERGDAFRVSYVAGDPRTAQKVAERLGSLFIDENLRDREALAEQTSQFLEGQLEDARRRLLDHEKKLEDYRRLHAGELPTQLQGNLQAIQNAEMQLQSLTEGMNRDRERRLLLERQLADIEATDSIPVAAPAPATVSDPAAVSGVERRAARRSDRLAPYAARPLQAGSSGRGGIGASHQRPRAKGPGRAGQQESRRMHQRRVSRPPRKSSSRTGCGICKSNLQAVDRDLAVKQDGRAATEGGDCGLPGQGQCGADA